MAVTGGQASSLVSNHFGAFTKVSESPPPELRHLAVSRWPAEAGAAFGSRFWDKYHEPVVLGEVGKVLLIQRE